MLGQEQGSDAKKTEIKQRHPGFVVSNETPVMPGRQVRQQEVIISPAVKQLNKDGYIVYNTPEKQDVYITIQPDSAFFDDEEPVMVKMAGGSFVSGNRQPAAAAMPMRVEAEPEHVEYVQPADIFCNACRREEYGEIDFNEIIIKENGSFEAEIEESPELFKPSYEEKYETAIEDSFNGMAIPEAAVTASESVEIGDLTPMVGYRSEPEYEVEDIYDHKDPGAASDYVEIHVIHDQEPAAEYGSETEYEVEDITDHKSSDIVLEEAGTDDIEPMAGSEEEPEYGFKEASEEKVPVTEVPAGLYVDGFRQIDAAEADSEDGSFSSFIEMSMEAEMAVTAETEPIAEQMTPLSPHVGYLCLPSPAEEVSICDVSQEEASETVTDMPIALEVSDEVADIMKLTVPSLCMSDELISELAQEWEIPDDGLEAYDCIFKPMISTVKEEETPIAAPSEPEEKELPLLLDWSVNARF